MGLTAIIGASFGWATYELFYWLNPWVRYRATTSWGAAWVVSVWRQHALHRWLTFRSRAPYGKSLRRAYLFALATGALGVVVNLQLTGAMGLPHRAAWAVGLVISALMSLLFLKRAVYREE
jgi:hypothetical protein